MRSILIYVGLLFFTVFAIQAQKIDAETDVQNQYALWKKEWSMSFRLHTNGYSLALENSYFMSVYKRWFWQFEFQGIKHEKEARIKSDPNLQRPLGRSYVYGKQNNFYVLHGIAGFKRSIAEKSTRSGVALSWSYGGGLALGVAKPYFLYLRQADNYNVAVAERYSTENEPRFLDNAVNPGTGSSTIVGFAGHKYGWSKLKPYAGLHLKSGLNFDWSSDDLFVKALEAGVSADIYYKKVPIMVGDQNHFFFPGFYIALQLGKRW